MICTRCGEEREPEEFYWSRVGEEIRRFYDRPCRVCNKPKGVSDARIANHRSLALTPAQRGGSAYWRS